jgi:prevent-host-death family protein
VKHATVAEMKAHLSAYLKASEDSPVIVTRNGKPVAVLVGVENEDELERLVLSYSKRLQSILELAHRQIREGGGIPHESFWEEVEAEAGQPDVKEGQEPAATAIGPGSGRHAGPQ